MESRLDPRQGATSTLGSTTAVSLPAPGPRHESPRADPPSSTPGDGPATAPLPASARHRLLRGSRPSGRGACRGLSGDHRRHEGGARERNAGLLPLHRVRQARPRRRLSRHRLPLPGLRGLGAGACQQLRPRADAAGRRAGAAVQADRQPGQHPRQPARRGQRRNGVDRRLLPRAAGQDLGREDADAIDAVQFAWASEKQHRDRIKQIQRWAPSLFETVARTIDEKTGRYFICQLCGSTTNRIPEGSCPICKNPTTQYRLIEPPA